MKDISLVFKYSFRLLRTEWRGFVLPFLSLLITTLVLMLILLLTGSSKDLIANEARDLMGGDVVIESNEPINTVEIWQEAKTIPDVESNQISFTGSILGEEKAVSVSVLVVDSNHPLYGDLILEEGEFSGINDTQILLDQNAKDRLGVEIGETVTFANTRYFVAGTIKDEPTTLINGLEFFPKVIISSTGFKRANIDPELLRAEYRYASKFENLTEPAKNKLEELDKENDYSVKFADGSESSFQFGLEIVEKFLIIALLITSVLAAVNIYASIVYLIVSLRKSLAIFLALGMKKASLLGILATSLGYVVVLASLFGALIGVVLFEVISAYVQTNYAITLPPPEVLTNGVITLALIFIIALGAFIPVVRKGASINPKQILLGGDKAIYEKSPKRNLFLISVSSLLPLVAFSSFVLKDVTSGVISILGIVLVYIIISITFYILVALLYRLRRFFPFFTRSIIVYKKSDGLFGVVSFTSLFMALTALCTLSLIQISLEKYLTDDLSSTLPTTYAIDIQASQKDVLSAQFPELNLFSNVSARIIDIDGVRVQEVLNSGSGEVSRELGREFNLTYRNELLENEEITEGSNVIGLPGEISVDEDFAKQADIKLGSEIVFLIQGFEVKGTVTSLRSSNSNSGLPFFYFVMSPSDISQFPSSYFGYADYGQEEQAELSTYVASNMPNVLVIETQVIGEAIIKIVSTLTLVVLIVTTPPLFIAALLIITLVISSYSSRRKEGARLRALGATKRFVFWQYLFETIFLTLVATTFAYALSVLISYGVNIHFLDFETSVIFDKTLILSLIGLTIFIGLIGWYLSHRDTMPLRELLSYEQNN